MSPHTRSRLQRITGPALILLAVLMAAQYVYLVSGVRHRAECQTRFNVSVASTLAIRARLTAASDESQTKLILGVATMMSEPGGKRPTAKERRAQEARYRSLFTEFVSEARRVAAERDANPIPTLEPGQCQ